MLIWHPSEHRGIFCVWGRLLVGMSGCGQWTNQQRWVRISGTHSMEGWGCTGNEEGARKKENRHIFGWSRERKNVGAFAVRGVQGLTTCIPEESSTWENRIMWAWLLVGGCCMHAHHVSKWFYCFIDTCQKSLCAIAYDWYHCEGAGEAGCGDTVIDLYLCGPVGLVRAYRYGPWHRFILKLIHFHLFLIVSEWVL